MNSVFTFLSKLFGVGENLTNPEQYKIKVVKRLNYRIEAAMQYVLVDQKAGEYKNITDKRQAKLKEHFSKRIFDVS